MLPWDLVCSRFSEHQTRPLSYTDYKSSISKGNHSTFGTVYASAGLQLLAEKPGVCRGGRFGRGFLENAQGSCWSASLDTSEDALRGACLWVAANKAAVNILERGFWRTCFHPAWVNASGRNCWGSGVSDSERHRGSPSIPPTGVGLLLLPVFSS